jgi:hypothetical protein
VVEVEPAEAHHQQQTVVEPVVDLAEPLELQTLVAAVEEFRTAQPATVDRVLLF